MKSKGRVGILLSDRGSNFEIAAVISDQEDARGLTLAKESGLNAFFVSPILLKPKAAYEEKILEILNRFKVELVCLAGYMRIVGKTLLHAYGNQRIINIHPALLPSFPGLHGQKQALDYGVKVSGCTVHFVDNGMDTGPIILQKAVEIKETDTEEDLSMRILTEEHKLYSEAITLFFHDKLKLEGRRVIILP